MREVETLLTRFPGPVTLHTSRTIRLVALAIFIGLEVFSVYLLVSGRAHDWYDIVMSGLCVVVFFAFTIRLVIMLVVPEALSLTLDANGFERRFLFQRFRLSWRDVSGFRVQESGDDRIPAWVTFDLIGAAAGPGHSGGGKANNALTYYGQSQEDLAWLMEQWRQRALAHHSPTHP